MGDSIGTDEHVIHDSNFRVTTRERNECRGHGLALQISNLYAFACGALGVKIA